MFEALVERHLYHFRDNASGDKVDAILEFRDGSYAAIEIKLSENYIDEAKKNLIKFSNNVKKKPKFMAIITDHFEAIMKDPKTGIYIFPITCLKP